MLAGLARGGCWQGYFGDMLAGGRGRSSRHGAAARFWQGLGVAGYCGRGLLGDCAARRASVGAGSVKSCIYNAHIAGKFLWGRGPEARKMSKSA